MGEWILACPLSLRKRDFHGDSRSYGTGYFLYFHLVPSGVSSSVTPKSAHPFLILSASCPCWFWRRLSLVDAKRLINPSVSAAGCVLSFKVRPRTPASFSNVCCASVIFLPCSAPRFISFDNSKRTAIACAVLKSSSMTWTNLCSKGSALSIATVSSVLLRWVNAQRNLSAPLSTASRASSL